MSRCALHRCSVLSRGRHGWPLRARNGQQVEKPWWTAQCTPLLPSGFPPARLVVAAQLLDRALMHGYMWMGCNRRNACEMAGGGEGECGRWLRNLARWLLAANCYDGLRRGWAIVMDKQAEVQSGSGTPNCIIYIVLYPGSRDGFDRL